MKGIASACGSATIINAIALGRGAAFAIDVRVESTVELEEEKSQIVGEVGDASEDPTLIETCVKEVLDFYGVSDKYGGKVRTTTHLPVAVGLSSSSAAANATVLATSIALGEQIEPEEAINLGIEAAFDAGTTITGAYDDASASYYGGGTITDNEERKLLKDFEIDPELNILIFLPYRQSYTVEMDEGKAKIISRQVEVAHEEALSGNIFGAQTLNGLLYSSILGYDSKPALEAIENGALSAGLTGTGPGIVAICEDDKVENIKNVWREYECDIMITNPSEEGARREDE